MIRSRTVNKIHELAVQGKSMQDIAITLSIARNTVHKYLRHPELVAMPHTPRYLGSAPRNACKSSHFSSILGILPLVGRKKPRNFHTSDQRKIVMSMTPEAFHTWSQRLQLSSETKALIASIRSSQPRGENHMNKVTCGITMSLDVFVAGLNQSAEKPFGDIPETILHRWMFEEPEKHQAQLNALTEAGAFIMGSNMYGPKEKRESPDWKGWWGENPPYHAPVFVLSHKQRDPITMEGGTTYIFIVNGIEAALSQAKAAAGQRNVAIMGGANTINQYLSAGLLDELWLHIVPVTCGAGARLFENVPNLQLEPLEISGTPLVTHIRYRVVKK